MQSEEQLPTTTRDPIISEHKSGELGRYRLIAELARGGMGVVYLALVRGPAGFNKLFVLKELKPHLVEDPNTVTMFLEEARLSAKLNHPNVVQTIEVGSDGNRHFIVMEYLEGQSLHRLLQRCKKTATKLPLHYHLAVLAGTLEGLHYAHSLTDFGGQQMNIVHRDVSPHNVFVTYDGQIKVVDFGIAKALDSASETRTGVLKGKVAYMAPEQASGQSLDGRADVFAAGVMLWEAATGKRMWADAQNDMQILHNLMNGVVPRPSSVNPDIPEALDQIILKATACNLAERYASSAELQADLEAYMKVMGAPPFGSRDLGKFLADMFAKERAEIKGLIDQQLRTLRGMASGEYQRVDLANLVGGAPTGEFNAMSSGSNPSVSRNGTSSGPVSATPNPGSISNSASISASGSVSREAPAPAGLRRHLAVLGVGAVALAGVIAFLALRKPEASADTKGATSTSTAAATIAAPPTAETTPTASAAATAAEKIKVTVSVSPSDARIFIDGSPVSGNPYTGVLPKDGANHKIRAEAQGYSDKSETFMATADAVLKFSLDSAATAAARPPVRGGGGGGRSAPPVVAAATTAAAPPTQVSAPPPPPPPATTTPPTKTKQRVIDTTNPFGG